MDCIGESQLDKFREIYLKEDSLPIVMNSDETLGKVIGYFFKESGKVFYFKSRGRLY